MKSFYSDSVLYYGDKISGDEVVTRQQDYFNAHPDYKLKITEYIGEEQLENGNWRVRISKQVTAGGNTSDYPASLTFGKQNGIWKIISESDDITDLKKGRSAEVHLYETITVEGLIEKNTGFRKNTSGGDAKSDNKEMYYVIWPLPHLDVIPLQSETKHNTTVRNVDRIQLVGNTKLITPLLGKGVRITGVISNADAQHSFTKVWLSVQKVEAMH